MISFSLCSSLDQLPEEPSLYPPTRYRLRASYKYGLDQGEGKDALAKLKQLLGADSSLPDVVDSVVQLEKHLGILEKQVTEQTDVNRIYSNAVLKIAYAEVERVLNNAWSFVMSRARAAKDLRLWTEVLPEVKSHLQNFQMKVPSGEIRNAGAITGPPGALAAIAIAAWLNELRCQANDTAAGRATALDDYLIRCRLLLKSWEDAELKRVFARSFP
jgi:hypothetical protein